MMPEVQRTTIKTSGKTYIVEATPAPSLGHPDLASDEVAWVASLYVCVGSDVGVYTGPNEATLAAITQLYRLIGRGEL
jgi:hypothetical protein